MAYNFDKDMFPCLSDTDFTPGFNSIGMEDLGHTEQDLMSIFIGALGPSISEFDETNILLVKADEFGLLDKVYGATIFRHEEAGLVLKLGANEFQVSQNKDGLVIGDLSGEIRFADKPTLITVKDDNGDEKQVEFWPASVELLYIPEGDEDNSIEFKVRCSWDPSTEAKPATIKAKIKTGKDISSYFRLPPSGNGGSGEAIKMQDLGVGEFLVTDIRKLEGGKYGDSFVLKLDDGREVWSRGSADIQLKARSMDGLPLLRPGVPTCLIVSQCVQRNDGKWSINCALRERLPGTGQVKAKPAAATPAKEPVATVAAPTATATLAAKKEYDDIPF
jgi:hypothetical protein